MTGDTTASGSGSVAAANITNSNVTTNVNQLPTPPAPPSALHQLARELSDFTGRTADLAILEAALNRDDGATVAITALHGMGGVGKTTLAHHAARRVIHRYPDAQIVVDLNGHGEGAPTAPLDAMLRVIRAFHPDTPPLDDPAQARAIYHSTLSGKRALILLDNAASADQIRDLIPPPHCGAIITARALVQPPDCTVLRLDLLSPDESAALLRRLAPNAQGTHDDWTRLADLCGRLPLALRVAGSTLAAADDLTLPDYLAELADEATRPHRLTIDGDASANVAAVLTHSLRRLIDQDPALAARWQMLSVIPADFDRAAAAALWEETDTAAAPRLRFLLARSLLLFDEAPRRYRLHDLMRPLARNLFAPDPTQDPAPGTATRLAAAEGRFALHFMGVLAEANELYLRNQDGVAAGLARYDVESNNIATAVAWAIDRTESDPMALQVAARLPNAGPSVLGLRLPQRERIFWLISAVTAARRMGDQCLAGGHLGNLGTAHAILGETQRAIAFCQQALAIAREIRDRRGEGNHLGNLGVAHANLGKTGHAIDFYEQALVIAREIGDRRGEGLHLGNLGLAHATLGETQRAIAFYQQALAIAREIGDRRGEGNRLGNLGLAHAALGETRHAIDLYQQALAIALEIGDRRGEGIHLGALGSAHAELGDVPTAITLTEQALAIFVAIESPYAEKARQQLARLRGEAADG
ncbi:tetratricopeptide repeat protein [Azospirillum sp.]|uniref:tetratricopeptide repeat protein n=1 Tax=Azospirillum sp. TaxID=34012 RepID=UPI002629546E|nr:tetratricopeptide repeat protein [Azospirillum sp.]